MSSTLLEHITAAVADEYAVLSQLGASTRGSAFLAREHAGGHLVVLTVPPSADELSVLGTVGDEVPANAGTCTACGEAPPTFTTFCPNCGRAFVHGAVGAHRFTADAVRAATAPAYEFLGEVAHQSGGSLFFVRDQADRRLVALSGQPAPGGGHALEAVWVAQRGDRAAPTPVPPFDAAAAESAAFGHADRANAPAAPGAEIAAASDTEHAFPFGGPPGYPPDYAPGYASGAGTAGELPVAPAGRRRWVPVAVVAVVVLAAGGAWAAMRGTRQAAPSAVDTPSVATAPTAGPPTPADTAATVPEPTPGSTGAAGGGGAVALPSITPTVDAPPTARVIGRPPVADPARIPATVDALVQLDGSALPAGWTWTVNGRRGPASLTVRLRPSRPAVLTIEAPGYCPETLQVDAPTPGGVQRWAPRLHGKPMVGEC